MILEKITLNEDGKQDLLIELKDVLTKVESCITDINKLDDMQKDFIKSIDILDDDIDDIQEELLSVKNKINDCINCVSGGSIDHIQQSFINSIL